MFRSTQVDEGFMNVAQCLSLTHSVLVFFCGGKPFMPFYLFIYFSFHVKGVFPFTVDAPPASHLKLHAPPADSERPSRCNCDDKNTGILQIKVGNISPVVSSEHHETGSMKLNIHLTVKETHIKYSETYMMILGKLWEPKMCIIPDLSALKKTPKLINGSVEVNAWLWLFHRMLSWTLNICVWDR